MELDLLNKKETPVKNSMFAKDIIKGLSVREKYIDSKYFYDSKGDEIFQKIMRMPEYYLTNCEYEIFSQQADNILKSFDQSGEGFDLIELGAGDGFKTKVLLQHFQKENLDFQYLPIDISKNVLDQLSSDLSQSYPDLEYETIQGEYFEALQKISQFSNRKKIILFLGANIGNFSDQKALSFLQKLNDACVKNDKILIGFDLKKSPFTILQAYNDSEGITKSFNLNLLKRINETLGTNFEITQFEHYPTYDPQTGLAKSYLVSLRKQKVWSEQLGKEFEFYQGEPIHTEISKKFSDSEIEELAKKAGFRIINRFNDCKHYFTDCLFEK